MDQYPQFYAYSFGRIRRSDLTEREPDVLRERTAYRTKNGNTIIEKN